MTQICHTPDSGLFCSRTRWLSIKFAILRKSRKIVVRGIVGVARRIGRLPPFGLRRLPRALWIGMLAVRFYNVVVNASINVLTRRFLKQLYILVTGHVGPHSIEPLTTF
jgi:hypothetical protein